MQFLPLILGIAISLSVVDAAAQGGVSTYPTKPVRLVVGYAPGGIVDSVARLLGTKLQEKWGQPVLVDNRPGASGGIGAELVSRAAPDGYTLMLGINSMLQAPMLDSQLRYDLERDLAPVALMLTSNYVLVSNPGMGVQNMAEFDAALRAAPQKYSYGSNGAGGTGHLYADQLARQLKAAPVQIPFKGGGPPIVAELMGGRIDFSILDMFSPHGHIVSGSLKALAVTGSNRSPLYPSVPTFAETGHPGFEVEGWLAMFAPKNTPVPLLHRLAIDISVAMAQPDVVEKVKASGGEVHSSNPGELAGRLKSDKLAWQKMISDAKLRPL